MFEEGGSNDLFVCCAYISQQVVFVIVSLMLNQAYLIRDCVAQWKISVGVCVCVHGFAMLTSV